MPRLTQINTGNYTVLLKQHGPGRGSIETNFPDGDVFDAVESALLTMYCAGANLSAKKWSETIETLLDATDNNT